MEWSSFVKPADVETDRQAEEFGKQEGIKVRVEHINANDLNARSTAAVESGTGPDIIRLLSNGLHLYATGLIDHGDLIQEVGGEDIYQTLRDAAYVDGVYRGVPYFSGSLAWDDTSNNRAFLGETISCTLNGASIYFVAKSNWDKKKDPFVWKLHHFLSPAGPAGRFHTFGGQNSCIMTYSKVQSAAKNYIRFIHKDENFEKFFVINNGYIMGVVPKWEKHEMWSWDPALTPYRELANYGKHIGYPGPYDRHASEVFAKYIVVDLYARAVKGESDDSVIKWAEDELKNIYS